MKLVFRSLMLHFCSIIIFAYLYYFDSNNFVYPDITDSKKTKQVTFFDCVYFATTIQAGVGYSSMYPTNEIGKTLLILQQLLMMASHVLTLYIFTL